MEIVIAACVLPLELSMSMEEWMSNGEMVDAIQKIIDTDGSILSDEEVINSIRELINRYDHVDVM